jgi:hypothetical protein
LETVGTALKNNTFRFIFARFCNTFIERYTAHFHLVRQIRFGVWEVETSLTHYGTVKLNVELENIIHVLGKFLGLKRVIVSFGQHNNARELPKVAAAIQRRVESSVTGPNVDYKVLGVKERYYI